MKLQKTSYNEATNQQRRLNMKRLNMKKIWFFLALMLAVGSIVTACSGKTVDCNGLMQEICQLFPDMPATESMYLSDTTSGGISMSEQDAAHIYTGEYGTLSEWSMLDSYAVRLPDRPQIYEIHILKVKNESDAETVSKLLCRRADLLAQYFVNPEKTGDYDYSSYRADVYMKGQYVFLLATPNNAAVIDLIEKKL